MNLLKLKRISDDAFTEQQVLVILTRECVNEKDIFYQPREVILITKLWSHSQSPIIHLHPLWALGLHSFDLGYV
jgi:hypothetical protein